MPVATMQLPTKSWVVGFWDAEGFSSVPETLYVLKDGSPKWYRYLRVGISQADQVVLEQIRDMFGGNVYDKGSGMYELAIQSSLECSAFTALLLKSSRNDVKRNELKENVAKCA